MYNGNTTASRLFGDNQCSAITAMVINFNQKTASVDILVITCNSKQGQQHGLAEPSAQPNKESHLPLSQKKQLASMAKCVDKFVKSHLKTSYNSMDTVDSLQVEKRLLCFAKQSAQELDIDLARLLMKNHLHQSSKRAGRYV